MPAEKNGRLKQAKKTQLRALHLSRDIHTALCGSTADVRVSADGNEAYK